MDAKRIYSKNHTFRLSVYGLNHYVVERFSGNGVNKKWMTFKRVDKLPVCVMRKLGYKVL